jgi:hypothetical protein
MTIQVGSAGQRLPGFLNVDSRKVEGVDIVGHARDLGAVAHLPTVARRPRPGAHDLMLVHVRESGDE